MVPARTSPAATDLLADAHPEAQVCTLAVKNDWAGIVVYGCVRDTVELAAQDIGVKALATHPRKSEKGMHSGYTERVVEFAGGCFRPSA
jgi:regulator of ribonuclease activity A